MRKVDGAFAQQGRGGEPALFSNLTPKVGFLGARAGHRIRRERSEDGCGIKIEGRRGATVEKKKTSSKKPTRCTRHPDIPPRRRRPGASKKLLLKIKEEIYLSIKQH